MLHVMLISLLVLPHTVLGLLVTMACGGDTCILRDPNGAIQCKCSGPGYQTCTIPDAARLIRLRCHKAANYVAAGFSNGFKIVAGTDKWRCADEVTSAS